MAEMEAPLTAAELEIIYRGKEKMLAFYDGATSALCIHYRRELAALRKRLAACEKDAERYRHVRAKPEMLLHLSNKDFDAAIDAALSAKQVRDSVLASDDTLERTAKGAKP